uniref:Addiction module antitoxin, RelB/DinJ family n=1 Tax=Candidatus Kentrum sp. LFY TaxID=2126342 RepID=A0A450U8H2_9GAMM|nr:MAG: addiction module antitoxin, RelB/DinJ family [Candidatus Kentron sp. LFY]
MSNTTMVRARLTPDLKERAERIFHRLGLNATQAITLFYRQVELRDELPFDIAVPTQATKRTFESSEAGRDVVVCEDADDMTCSASWGFDGLGWFGPSIRNSSRRTWNVAKGAARTWKSSRLLPAVFLPANRSIPHPPKPSPRR